MGMQKGACACIGWVTRRSPTARPRGEPRIQHPPTELAAIRQRATRRGASSKRSWSRDTVEWTISDMSHRKD
eukprot:1888664-Prymnesium_polylepis.1